MLGFTETLRARWNLVHCTQLFGSYASWKRHLSIVENGLYPFAAQITYLQMSTLAPVCKERDLGVTDRLTCEGVSNGIKCVNVLLIQAQSSNYTKWAHKVSSQSEHKAHPYSSTSASYTTLGGKGRIQDIFMSLTQNNIQASIQMQYNCEAQGFQLQI